MIENKGKGGIYSWRLRVRSPERRSLTAKRAISTDGILTGIKIRRLRITWGGIMPLLGRVFCHGVVCMSSVESRD